MVEFRILGPLEVAAENRVVPLGGPKQRATLAILLLNANRVVSVERIADDLYAGAAPVTAVTQVQRQISALRKALGAAVIETRARVRRPPRCRRAGPAPVRAAGDSCREQQRANNQQERSEIQQERIDLAARELASVSDRLQAAADALRESI